MALIESVFSAVQFRQLLELGREIRDELRKIADRISDNTAANTEGFSSVAKAISDLSIPPADGDSAVEGTIVARYKFTEDQAPVDFKIVGKDFKSGKGTPTGAGDIDLSVESSSPNLTATLSNQQLSADGSEVSADVHLEGAAAGMPTADLAVVTYKATNRDTGNVVAADVDEFETGAGEAGIGTIDSPVPLPEVTPPAPTGDTGGIITGDGGTTDTGGGTPPTP